MYLKVEEMYGIVEEGMRRGGRRRKQPHGDITETTAYVCYSRGSNRSRSVENRLWKWLWACRKTDKFRMMMIMIVIMIMMMIIMMTTISGKLINN